MKENDDKSGLQTETVTDDFSTKRIPVISVKNLVKKFGHFVANDHLTFEVYKGEIFGFLGANGAGKTTAMRILCGLSSPSSGELTVGGYDVYKQAEFVITSYSIHYTKLYDLQNEGVRRLFWSASLSGVIFRKRSSLVEDFENFAVRISILLGELENKYNFAAWLKSLFFQTQFF